MPYLSHLNFDTVHVSLKATLGMIESALPQFDWGKSALDVDAIQSLNETPGLVRDALKLMDDAKDAIASDDLRELANDIYGTNEIEIDDEGVGTSEGADGIWVQAWVWVEHDRLVLAGLRHEDDTEAHEEAE